MGICMQQSSGKDCSYTRLIHQVITFCKNSFVPASENEMSSRAVKIAK